MVSQTMLVALCTCCLDLERLQSRAASLHQLLHGWQQAASPAGQSQARTGLVLPIWTASSMPRAGM